MTNNSARTTVRRRIKASAQANPRVPNFNGHIIELSEDGGDYASHKFTWEIFLLVRQSD